MIEVLKIMSKTKEEKDQLVRQYYKEGKISQKAYDCYIAGKCDFPLIYQIMSTFNYYIYPNGALLPKRVPPPKY